MSSYKKRNKPLREDQTRYKQGYFHIPKEYIHKYIGDPSQIIYRSSYEYKFLLYCCYNPNILKFGSEVLSVKYLNPVTNLEYNKKNNLNNADPRNWKLANYWIDFWILVKKRDGTESRVLIEIKPHCDTLPPKPTPLDARMKQRKAFIRQSKIYLENKAKWEAATQYAKDNGMEFLVVTERTMKDMGIM